MSELILFLMAWIILYSFCVLFELNTKIDELFDKHIGVLVKDIKAVLKS